MLTKNDPESFNQLNSSSLRKIIGWLSQSDSQQHGSVPSYCIRYCQQSCIQSTIQTEFTLSTIFTLLTLGISIYHIYMHLIHFNNPFFQSKIIVIMIMAPFYCVTSMGSLIWPALQPYFTLTRDFYQAILLFTFFYLIFSYLAYDRQKDVMEDKKVYLIMIAHEKQVHHFFPFGYCQKPYQLSNWKKAKYFTYRCKKYVLQFLIVKIVTTLLLYIIYPNVEQRKQGEQYSSYAYVQSLFSWIVAISASYSLYYLVLFYHALSSPLSPYSPLLKFLTIKITLFFTFWQRIMISIFEEDFLQCFDHEAPSYHSHEIISSLQNTLICFQMLVMAFAGGLAYNYDNYISRVKNTRGTFWMVIKDTIRTFKKDSRLIKPKKFGFDTTHKSEVELKSLHLTKKNSRQAEVRMSLLIEKNVVGHVENSYIAQYF